MATVKTLVSGSRKLIVNITHTWVTADETNVVVVDRSALVGSPNNIRVDEITWSITPGLEIVKLSWDLATDEVIEILSGQGYMDYRSVGGKNPGTAPATATEGDILLSTVGGAAGDAYSILLHCTLGN